LEAQHESEQSNGFADGHDGHQASAPALQSRFVLGFALQYLLGWLD